MKSKDNNSIALDTIQSNKKIQLALVIIVHIDKIMLLYSAQYSATISLLLVTADEKYELENNEVLVQ